MKDFLNIGSTPPAEDCEQLGPNYDVQKAKEECQRYIDLLRKLLAMNLKELDWQ